MARVVFTLVGLVMELNWAALGLVGAPVGRRGGPLGLLGRFAGLLGRLGALFGSFGAFLAVRGSFVAVWGLRGALSGRLGSLGTPSLGKLGALLGPPCWAMLAPPVSFLSRSGTLEAPLAAQALPGVGVGRAAGRRSSKTVLTRDVGLN